MAAGHAFSLAAATASCCPSGMATCLQSVPMFRATQAAHVQLLSCALPELQRLAAAGPTGFDLFMGYGKLVHALLAAGAELSEHLQVRCLARPGRNQLGAAQRQRQRICSCTHKARL